MKSSQCSVCIELHHLCMSANPAWCPGSGMRGGHRRGRGEGVRAAGAAPYCRSTGAAETMDVTQVQVHRDHRNNKTLC